MRFLLIVASVIIPPGGVAFAPSFVRTESTRRDTVMMARGMGLRNTGESKRQARVGQLMRTEIASIIRKGAVKTYDPLSDTLREKISVVDVQMSSDLRSARVFVSVFGDAVDKRKAYAWLVEHSKQFKHSLSQRLKDMKGVPDINFKEADISAAVDVMSTIDRLARDRASSGESGEEMPAGMIDGLDFDLHDDDFDDDFDGDDIGFDAETDSDDSRKAMPSNE
mmetsp:Transcript_24412/g.55041  ORF Transcript_24412/g.55041 Transcript_24412/m.55041 type:complete len:223 (+) Transcript_24412:86-754(+)